MTFTNDEIQAMHRTSGKAQPQGFTPKAKGDRPGADNQQSSDQSQLTTYDNARERLESSSLATSNLVGQTIAAAQSLAKTQADAIEHFPQLVDQLTVMYLQERGLTDLGKPSAAPFNFEVEIPAMAQFNALMASSGAAARQIVGDLTVHQLPEGS